VLKLPNLDRNQKEVKVGDIRGWKPLGENPKVLITISVNKKAEADQVLLKLVMAAQKFH
jgi:hypothetical protein